jgi:hypothetical protein
MSRHRFAQIVANGQERIRATAAYRSKVREIHKQVRERRADEYFAASFLRRIFLRVVIWYEIRREVRKLVPDQALYLNL